MDPKTLKVLETSSPLDSEYIPRDDESEAEVLESNGIVMLDEQDIRLYSLNDFTEMKK